MEDLSNLATSTSEYQVNSSRRRFLGVIGAGTAGLVLSPAEALAAPWPSGGVGGSPLWNQFINEYAAYLAKQRLRNISVRQVIYAHMKTRGTVRNTPPPRSMWKNIVATLRVADRIASELRSPVVEVVSAYRSPSYNARCPGAKRESMHTRNLALDLKFATSPRNVAAMAERLRDKRYFKGGIGRYGTFTHIDTRGENVDWNG